MAFVYRLPSTPEEMTMPQTVVVFYAEGNVSPFLGWMDGLSAAVQDKLIARIELLEGRGHELRRRTRTRSAMASTSCARSHSG